MNSYDETRPIVRDRKGLVTTTTSLRGSIRVHSLDEHRATDTKTPEGEQPAGARRAAINASAVTLPLALAAILGVLQVWGTIGTGYFAGWGDHFVLSPEGISWANPGAFENDWFMEVAPQPHWFFDVLTFLGASTGTLTFVYVAFWATGLLAFGWATALLAFRFFPTSAWPVALAVTGLSAITPWMIGGTGSGMIAQALPAVVSANLIYLLIAAMLTEYRVLVVVLAPLIAVVHVQQGAIGLVLVVALLAVEGVRLRKVDWYLVGAGALTAGVVAFGLLLRPVASNLQDFVQICDEIIPYHCAAHLWSRNELLSTAGLIILAVLSAVVIPKAQRWIWYSTVGLATLGYVGGFVSDALRIPLLGTLAQGVNVYRLGAVLVPFAVWGALAPMLVRPRKWKLALLLGAWFLGWVTFLFAPGFPTDLRSRLVLMLLALIVPLCWFLMRTARDGEWAVRSGQATLAAALIALMVTAASGGLTARAPNFAFIGDADLRAWGAQVREVVPEGEVIVASPRFEWVKLVTQRAVIADCKDVPYGGDAWNEWQRRLDHLGGTDQCVAPGPQLFDELTARDLVSVADEYESDYIVLNPTQTETLEELEELGWTREVGQVNASGAVLLRRPS